MATRSLLALSLVLLVSLASGAEAAAGPSVPMRPAPVARTVPAAQAVSVKVTVVHATEGPIARVDPRLRTLQPHLASLRQNQFDVIDTRSSNLVDGKPRSFDMPGERTVKVTVLDHDANRARIRMEMLRPSGKLIDTTVSIPRGRTMVVAGPQWDGGILVVPISVGR